MPVTVVPDRDFVAGRNRAVGHARGIGIDVRGLADLQRALREFEPEVAKQLRKDLREAAKPVLMRARELAPVRSGKLASSLRISVTNRGISIGSRLPYAGVIHWGGTTGPGHKPNDPWSGSVAIRESLFLSSALAERDEALMDELEQIVDRVARREGFN